jgi:hypothetical protein
LALYAYGIISTKICEIYVVGSLPPPYSQAYPTSGLDSSPVESMLCIPDPRLGWGTYFLRASTGEPRDLAYFVSKESISLSASTLVNFL